MKWETVELLGYTFYSEKGYNILVQLVKDYGYDFVIEKNGNFKRVQVKTAWLRKDRDIYQISKSPTKNDYTVEIILAYLPDKEKFIELPGTFFDNVKYKVRSIPKEITDGV